MNLKLYKLHFTTPLHLSNESEDYAQSLQTLHSDTLYAALTSVLAKVGHNFDKNFAGDLGFSISSLFPFYQKDKEDKNPVYFFPKSHKIDILSEDLLAIHKYVKKIRWIDTFFFEKHLKAENLERFYAEKTIKPNGKIEFKHLKGSYLTNNEYLSTDFISSQVFPHAQVPRQQIIEGTEQDTKIYYMERLFFKDYSGMYFIAEGEADLLEKALNILQYEGIGTDRNVGNGYFEWSKSEINLDLPQSEYAMNLSLFLPENKEQLSTMLDDKSAYVFKKRGGWVTTSPYNTIRKNRVHMFEEGSVFKTNKQILGRIADLTPTEAKNLGLNHKILRNGKSLFIPIKIEKEVSNGK